MRSRKDLDEALFLLTTSADHYLSERFESPYVKTALGWHSINDSLAGPSTLRHGVRAAPRPRVPRARRRAATVGLRAWRHGPGDRGDGSRRRARPAPRSASGSVSTRSSPAGPATTWWSPASSSPTGRPSAPTWCCRRRSEAHLRDGSATPRTCPATSCAAVRNIRSDGTSIKINLALDRLPTARGQTGDGRAAVPPRDPRARPDARRAGPPAGRTLERGSRRPARTSRCASRPCTTRPSHPTASTSRRSTSTPSPTRWPRATGTRSRRASPTASSTSWTATSPASRSSVLHRQVLSPLDLERILGLTGGHALHGEMAPDQLFMNRPGARLRRLPHADRRALPVRRRDPSRRRGERRQRTQLCPEVLRDLRRGRGWLRRRDDGRTDLTIEPTTVAAA